MQSITAQRFFDVMHHVMYPGPFFPKPIKHGGDSLELSPSDGLTRQDTINLRNTCRAMAALIPPDNGVSARRVAIELKHMMTGGPDLIELGRNIMAEEWRETYRDNVTPPNMLAEIKAMLRSKERKRLFTADGNTERQNALLWLGVMTGTSGALKSQEAFDGYARSVIAARGSNPERNQDFKKLAYAWGWESGVPMAICCGTVLWAWSLGPLPVYLGATNGQAVVAIGFEPEESIPIPHILTAITGAGAGLITYGAVRNLADGLLASRDVWGPQIFRDRMLAELMLTHQTLSLHAADGPDRASDVQLRWDMRRVRVDPYDVLNHDLTAFADTVGR